MGKRNPYVASLQAIPKRLAKGKPTKAYELLNEAFLIFAASGDVPHAAAVIKLVYESALPRPTKVVHAFGTGPMDGFCAAVGLGDLTNGEPRARHLAEPSSLEKRVERSEALVRRRITSDAYTQFPPPMASWEELEGRELWRKAQILARPALPDWEREALQALTRYMDAWCNDAEWRGAGYGQEIALACYLAIRQGADERIHRWCSVLGPHLMRWGVSDALCLPAVARAITEGLLQPIVDLPVDKTKELFEAIDSAARELGTRVDLKPDPPGKPIIRTVSAGYSQFYLEPANPTSEEVYFQDERESAQGMSIFANKIGIATPSETSECFVEVTVKGPNAKSEGIGAAVQAVSFPFVVEGPLFVRSVDGGGGDEDRDIVIPPGSYEVLARFFAKRATKADAASGLRAFRVTLDFYPKGSLGAPQCLKIEDGTPPQSIFVNR